jgi:hypothetical protein
MSLVDYFAVLNELKASYKSRISQRPTVFEPSSKATAQEKTKYLRVIDS